MTTQVNKETLDLIRAFEGERLKVYLDPIGKPTVGVGHLVRPKDKLKVGQKITREQAEAFLLEDLRQSERDVDSLGLYLTANQYGSLVSFAFNLGRSNLRKLVSKGLVHIADRFLLFDYAAGKRMAGLTRRRKAERKLFLK